MYLWTGLPDSQYTHDILTVLQREDYSRLVGGDVNWLIKLRSWSPFCCAMLCNTAHAFTVRQTFSGWYSIHPPAASRQQYHTFSWSVIWSEHMSACHCSVSPLCYVG